MLSSNSTVCIFFIIALLFISYLLCSQNKSDGFIVSFNDQPLFGECKIDEDCPSGEFCYMGRCWRYWKGNAMPWSTCRSPFCGCSEPGCNCSPTQNPGNNTCLPYCKCELNRRPGGTISQNCFPKCGAPCLNNDDCPAGCPECSHGICSAPSKGSFIK